MERLTIKEIKSIIKRYNYKLIDDGESVYAINMKSNKGYVDQTPFCGGGNEYENLIALLSSILLSDSHTDSE
jgi:adenine specific DNA methylase Mod